LINIKGTDSIAAVTKVLREDEAEEVSDEFEGDVEEGEIDETSEGTQE
jgi:DNA gyrase subunit A